MLAFDEAMKRPRRKLTSATKSNGISITMPYWDERVAEMSKAYPQVSVDRFHIDILTAHFVQRPQQFDVVVAMTHDQGLIPLKLVHFEDGVNVTMGLPIVRTSVDHGTAYDIAGTGTANPSSLLAAVRMAANMVGKR